MDKDKRKTEHSNQDAYILFWTWLVYFGARWLRSQSSGHKVITLKVYHWHKQRAVQFALSTSSISIRIVYKKFHTQIANHTVHRALHCTLVTWRVWRLMICHVRFNPGLAAPQCVTVNEPGLVQNGTIQPFSLRVEQNYLLFQASLQAKLTALNCTVHVWNTFLYIFQNQLQKHGINSVTHFNYIFTYKDCTYHSFF